MRALQRAYRLLPPRRRRALGAARVALQLAFGELLLPRRRGRRPGAGWSAPSACSPGMEPGVEHGLADRSVAGPPRAAGRPRPAARPHARGGRPRHRPGLRRDRRRDHGAGARGLVAMVSEGEVDEGMRRLDEATAAAVGGEVDDLDAISQLLLLPHRRLQAHPRLRAAPPSGASASQSFSERWSDRLTFAACRAHYADILIWRGDLGRGGGASCAPTSARWPRSTPSRIADGMVRLAELRRRQGLLDGGRAGCPRRPTGHPSPRWCAASWRSTAATRPAPSTRPSARCGACPGRAAPTARAALELLVRARAGRRRGRRGARRRPSSCGPSLALGHAPTQPRRAASFAGGRAGERRPGSWEAARRALEDAVDLYARAGGRWEAARAPARAGADAARARPGRGRRARGARRRRGAAHAGGRRRRRARGEPRRAHPARGRGAAARRPGRSNQEIATELVLSVRTVERHIANIYDKIGASGRAARAAAASYALAVGVCLSRRADGYRRRRDWVPPRMTARGARP